MTSLFLAAGPFPNLHLIDGVRGVQEGDQPGTGCCSPILLGGDGMLVAWCRAHDGGKGLLYHKP